EHRFVEPAKSQLRTRALAATYLNDTVLKQLDQHASRAWENICQQHVMREALGVSAVGRWWGKVPTGQGQRTEEREIDVVGINGSKTPLVVGMCKWTNSDMDFDELNLLERLAQHVEGHTGTEQRYLFSRSGFSARLRAHASSDRQLHLVTPADIYW
ncbi:MAG: DUF234 domain-containing protein, partial [Mycobacteriales bacterium]